MNSAPCPTQQKIDAALPPIRGVAAPDGTDLSPRLYWLAFGWLLKPLSWRTVWEDRHYAYQVNTCTGTRRAEAKRDGGATSPDVYWVLGATCAEEVARRVQWAEEAADHLAWERQEALRYLGQPHPPRPAPARPWSEIRRQRTSGPLLQTEDDPAVSGRAIQLYLNWLTQHQSPVVPAATLPQAEMTPRHTAAHAHPASVSHDSGHSHPAAASHDSGPSHHDAGHSHHDSGSSSYDSSSSSAYDSGSTTSSSDW